MNGKFCTSFQHLIHYAENSTHKKVLICPNGRDFCLASLYKSANKLFIFNNIRGHIKDLSNYTKIERQAIEEKSHEYAYTICVEDTISKEWFMLHFQSCQFILLPNDFFDNYDKFIHNNSKQFRQNITDKFGLSSNHATLLYLYCICGDSMNFMAWTVKNIFACRIPVQIIYYILQWNEKYYQFANKLHKGSITSYSGFNQINDLVNELSEIRKAKRINDSINQFNTTQKKILKEASLDSQAKFALNNFAKLSDVKRLNFIRKVSTIDNYSEIMSQMISLCDVHFSWNKESVLEYIKNNEFIKCNIVLDRDNILLVTSKDYETIKRLAKTTNWCISKNKRYWNDYVEFRKNATQYVLFDFGKKEDDELSIVGFTVISNQGITNAHSFTNQNLIGEQAQIKLVSFEPTLKMNIYSILNNHNIPLDIFLSEDKMPFKWNRESVFKHIHKYVPEYSIDIIYDENDKVCFIVKNPSIHKIFNSDSFAHFDTFMFEYKCFFFLDFTKDFTDPTKFVFCSIYNSDSEQETPSNLYNYSLYETIGSFDELLEEYNLPYDVIKRIDSTQLRFIQALSSYNIKVLDKLLKEPNVSSIFENKDSNSELFCMVEDSVIRFKSFDLLNVFYQNGIKLSDVFHTQNVGHLLGLLIQYMYNTFMSLNRIPTDKDYSDLIEHKLNNANEYKYIGWTQAFNLIYSNEPKECLCQVINTLTSLSFNNLFTMYYVNKFFEHTDNIEEPAKTRCLTRLMSYAVENNITSLMVHLSDMGISKPQMSHYVKKKYNYNFG